MIRYGYGLCALITGVLILRLLKRKKDNPKTSYTMGVLNMALTPLSILRLGPFKYGHRINLVSASLLITC
jgi:hypothetical protein